MELILKDLLELRAISVKRHVLCCTQRNVELPGFCDSSGQTYGAVVYVRVMCSHGVSITLWAGKCRLAPMKNFLMARLELLSCLLLSKFITMVVKAVEVEVKVNKVFWWSDLQIAIWWICQIGKKWKCWIQNRVDAIRENVAVENWYYVPTKLNPADISTRKAKLDKSNEKLWWNGPEFLLDVVEKWLPQELRNSVKEKDTADISDEILACRVVVEPLIIGIGKIIDLEWFSSMDRLLRVTS